MDKETKEGVERMAELVGLYKDNLEEKGIEGELLFELVVSYQESLFNMLVLGQQMDRAKQEMINQMGNIDMDDFPGGVN